MMRQRLWQTILIGLVMACGLFTRSHVIHWPWFVTAYVGDVLWAWLVFLGIGWIWLRLSTNKIALSALLFAFLIEFSQLYHAPWLDGLRSNRIAALVLGQGFLWSDLVCYVVGIAVGALVERRFFLRPTS